MESPIEKKTLTISRKTWGRGTGNGKLLDVYGMKCCLGFAAEQLCGATRDDILGHCTPSDTKTKLLFAKELAWLQDTEDDLCVPSDECSELMRTNDRIDYNDDVREKKIAEIFLTYDIEVIFTD